MMHFYNLEREIRKLKFWIKRLLRSK